jgi:hypothetical protein
MPSTVEQRTEFVLVGRQVRALQHDAVLTEQPDRRGDRPRGAGMVTGHHGEPDTGRTASADRLGHVRLRRVLQTDQTEQFESLLHHVLSIHSGHVWPVGDGEDSQAAAAQLDQHLGGGDC